MRVLVPTGCRSDAGLIQPVIKRLKEKGVDIKLASLDPNNFLLSYKTIREIVESAGEAFDIALICGDRVEMCGAAAACFHSHIPIAHMYAGTGTNISTFDDINRHVMTLWSDIQFCESDIAAKRVENLFSAIGKKPDWHVVGITHMDDIDMDNLDTTLVFEKPYDLILYNPITYGSGRTLKMYEEVRSVRSAIAALDGTKLIAISPNPDDDGYVESLLKAYAHRYYSTTPRDWFLGLLKNCQRFITNSSTAIYEAPYFLKPDQIIHIGERNRDRDKGPFMTGASQRIVEVLQRWYIAKNGNETGNSLK